MLSRGNLKRAIAAVVAGVLIGGGVTAVSPAGAEVSQFAATNWKKIWKKKLQPQADKRYYTKAASDVKYAAAGSAYSKAEVDAKLGGYYTKAQADAKYQPVGNYAATGSSYTKTESDAKYAPYPKTIRGTYMVSDIVPAAGNDAFSFISFGVTLASAPTAVFKPTGGPANPNCTGTAAAPQAAPGFLCIYEGTAANSTDFVFASAAGTPGAVSPFGVVARITAVAGGLTASLGGWAVTPANGVTATVNLSEQGPGSGNSLLP